MSAAYCVDCYADGGRVTVATRKFKDDDVCERHYRALCKDMGIEPEPVANKFPQPVQSIALAGPLAERAAASPRAPRLKKVSSQDATQKGRPEFSKAQVAPSQDRDSAVSPQPSKPERSAKTMAKLCACGCGEELNPGSPWKFKRGHASRGDKTTAGKPAKSGAQPPSAVKSDGHTAGPAFHPQGPNPPMPAITNGNGVESNARNMIVMCGVSEFSMDRIWTSLTPEEKAQLLFPSGDPAECMSSRAHSARRFREKTACPANS